MKKKIMLIIVSLAVIVSTSVVGFADDHDAPMAVSPIIKVVFK